MNIPLFAQSCYSLLEGVLPPAALVDAAVEQGYQTIVLCDHGYLIGAVEFSLACKDRNVRPILGLEIDVLSPPVIHKQNNRLLLIALNATGWGHLCKLSSLMQTTHRPVTLQDLNSFSDGLVCLSGGRNGWIETLVQQKQYEAARDVIVQLSKIFTSNFYIQVTRQSKFQTNQEKFIIDLAERMNTKVCAVPFAIFSKPAQSEIQRSLLAIKHTCLIEEINDRMGYDPGATIFPVDQTIDTYQDIPEALENCNELVNSIQFEITTGISRLPKIQIEGGMTAEEALRERAYAGAYKLYGEITAEIDQRLQHELTIIHAQGFEPIFLIMEEGLNYARAQGILFSSRGSAASSLVAHCLGITSPDPMRLGLYFERFLNPARKTPPDIDTDIDSNRRDELIQHFFNQYGRENVTMVGTINRFRPRSAVGDIAKACGLTPVQARKLAQELPYAFFASRSGKDDSTIFDPLRQKYLQPAYQEVFNRAQSILGLPRHLSMHPGGVVISPTPTTDLTPVSFSGSKEVTITQFDLDSLEALGLVKLDLLGIRGLSVMAGVANSIYSWRRKEYANPGMVLEDIPETDQLTSDLICAGKTIGCFQIESPGMRSTLKQIHAQSIDDLMAALALYRPGPLRGGLRDAFIARHNHLEPVTQIHTALENVLADTYGVILYQEQVLRIAHQVAGLSLADSDLLRRAMSHFDPGKQMQHLKEKFIQGALEKNQIEPSTADKIWEMMAAFAGYGFPKAHAASYAEIAWRSAWCKTYFPAEFTAAVLANWGGYYSQRVYLMEARRLGLTVKPPHINHSNHEFCVAYAKNDPELYMGLNQVRGLTHRTITKILQNRPFTGLNDFIARVNPRYEEASNLINCGALDGLPDIHQELNSAMRNRFTGQLSLFEMESSPNLEKHVSSRKRELDQETILGISIDSHPLEKFQAAIQASGAIPTSDVLSHHGEKIHVVGVCQLIHRSRASSGNWMAFLTIEDQEGMLDVILFPEIYRRTPGTILNKTTPLLIEGIIEMDENSQEPVLRAEKIQRFVET